MSVKNHLLFQRSLLTTLLLILHFHHQATEAFRVFIVGGGASGIAAATRLLLHGVTDVTVLEAECRRGGRIYSIPFGEPNRMVDLGAEWCHGQVNNTVYNLVEQYGILRSTPNRSRFICSNGGRVVEDAISHELNEFIGTFENSITEEERSLSHGDFLIKRYDEIILEKYKTEPEKLKFFIEAFPTVSSFPRSLEGAFYLRNVSLVGDYIECEGDQHLNWNGLGYGTILDVMIRAYPDDKLKLPLENHMFLNRSVSKIKWVWYNNKVRIECADGTVYSTDHVIFTPSLGVLKANHKNLFKPDLPNEKVSAINTLGFGAIMKIYLRFGEKWWSGNFTPTALVWSAEDRLNLAKSLGEGPIDKNGESWLSSVYSISEAENNPKVLVAWITGPFIPAIELASDDVILKGMDYTLNKFFPNHGVKDIEEIRCTRWYTNQNFRGAYSYDPTGMQARFPKAREILAKPLMGANMKPLVLFAGEATHSTHFATVHGAIDSGYAAADEILRFHNMI